MKIKKASINEIEKLAILFDKYRVFYKQESNLELAKEFLLSRIQNNESIIYYLIDNENEIVAFVQLYPSFSSVTLKRTWILNDLFVHERHRRKGYAKMLMEKSMSLALKTKAKKIFLKTAVENKKAQILYESLAYKKDKEFYSYFLDL